MAVAPATANHHTAVAKYTEYSRQEVIKQQQWQCRQWHASTAFSNSHSICVMHSRQAVLKQQQLQWPQQQQHITFTHCTIIAPVSLPVGQVQASSSAFLNTPLYLSYTLLQSKTPHVLKIHTQLLHQQ